MADPRPYRVPRDLVDPLLHELGAWLDGAGLSSRVGDALRAGEPRMAPALRRLIVAQGLAPCFVRDPAAARVLAALPDELQAWLSSQDDSNRRRIERLLGELAIVLRAFATAGVAVMPLKGAILASRPGSDPFRRPMADLDLLVRPVDLDAARAALTSLGYCRRPDLTRRATHDTFELPGNEAVVSLDGEHPDNPRPIELHVEVRRHLWGWVDDDDLTGYLWADATEASILGEPAILPAASAFAAHLAIHATSDLLLRRGRLVQWLDLAEVVGEKTRLAAGRLPHPRLAYPALRLAMRRLPSRFPRPGLDGPDGLATLEARVPPVLARWAGTVSLDTQAGLQAARTGPADNPTLGARWTRWAPYRWRMAVAHGDAPLPVAALRHARRVVATARRRPT